MPKIVFPTKIDSAVKTALNRASEIAGISTNALAEKLMMEGALQIIDGSTEPLNKIQADAIAELRNKINNPDPKKRGIGAGDFDTIPEPL